LNALTAALAIEVVLRWPSVGFHGATAVVATAALAPLFVSAVGSLSGRARRAALFFSGGVLIVAVILALPLFIEGLSSRHAVENGVAKARAALHGVSAGDSQAARQQLVLAAADFGSARGKLDTWWTAGTRIVPVASQQRQALVEGVNAAEGVASTTAGAADLIDYGSLRYKDGGIDLAAIEALSAPLASVNSALAHASTDLARARSGWDLAPISDRTEALSREITQARSTTLTAEMAVKAAPSMLGADGTRHYFVAFIDPAESRGLGGLMVWYGDLAVTNGRVTLESYGDTPPFGPQLASMGARLTGPPDYLARYGQFKPQDSFIDVTYAPDLPTVADVIAQLYSQLGHPPIDGVMVLDPRSLASLVSVTGPVSAPGLGVLTGSNTQGVLDKGQYAVYQTEADQQARKEALNQALAQASTRLTSGSMPGARAFFQELGPDVRDGDLMFWSLYPQEQPLLERAGLAGQFPNRAGGDLLSVVTQNAANNKIDAYLHRTISDQVSYEPATGQVESTVEVTLHNSAPKSGLSDQVIGSYPGSGLTPGSDELWFSIYSPLALKGATVGNKAIELQATPELGVETYSGYVTVPPGGQETIVVHLAGRVDRGAYHLALYQQPTVVADEVSVRVSPARGWTVEGAPVWRPPTERVPSHSFSFKHN